MTLLIPIGASHRLTEPSLSVLPMLKLVSLTAPNFIQVWYQLLPSNDRFQTITLSIVRVCSFTVLVSIVIRGAKCWSRGVKCTNNTLRSSIKNDSTYFHLMLRRRIRGFRHETIVQNLYNYLDFQFILQTPSSGGSYLQLWVDQSRWKQERFSCNLLWKYRITRNDRILFRVAKKPYNWPV